MTNWVTPPVVFSDGSILTAAQLNTTINAIVSGTVANTNGGTGLDSSGWTGVPSVSSGTWAINTKLTVALGGTNSATALNNNRVMVSSGGAVVEAAALTNGQVLLGSTGAAPVAASLTAGSNITLTPGAGTLTVAASSGFTGLTTIQYVRRTSDGTAVNNSTTLVSDSVLLAALAASEVVSFQCHLFVSAAAAADMKIAFTVPAAATIVWGPIGNVIMNTAGAAAFVDNVTASGTAMSFGTNGTANPGVISIQGTVVNGANTGNLQLQMAQVAADVSDAKILANSYMLVFRV